MHSSRSTRVTELCLEPLCEFYSSLHESSSPLSYLLKHATCLTLQGFMMLLNHCCVVEHFEDLKCSIKNNKKGTNKKSLGSESCRLNWLTFPWHIWNAGTYTVEDPYSQCGKKNTKELHLSKGTTKVSQSNYYYFFLPAVDNVPMHISVILTKFYCGIPKDYLYWWATCTVF